MKQKKIAVLPGDGIGPEVMEEAKKVLSQISKKARVEFEYTYGDIGGCAFDKHGNALPKKTLEICEKSDAILFGSIGGPKWDSLPEDKKVEKRALLGIRKHFGLYANLRPAILYPSLIKASPLKKEIVKEGFDVMIVRELTGDVYFGEKKLSDDHASDLMEYKRFEIERIANTAFMLAMKRKKYVVCVDKANVLSTSVLFRKFTKEAAIRFPEVRLDFMYVDNFAMQIIRRPKDFDVVVTSNLFGDILSDEAAVLTGSIGMLASASLNEKNFGLYEPAGGSAPDIAGKKIANPIAQILSCAMMLRYSFGLDKEAKMIEDAVIKTLVCGYRTKDIMEKGKKELNTCEMGDMIARNISKK